MFQKTKQFFTHPISKFQFNYRWLRFWRWPWSKIIRTLIILTFLTASIFVIKEELYYWGIGDGGGDSESTEGYCNVQGLELHGELVTYLTPEEIDENGYAIVDKTASQNLVASISDANDNRGIRAILLEVDSYGGSPVAGEEISEAVKNSRKPVIVLIRSGGVSAAYLASASADRIFASKNSDVGGIGVTMSYLDSTQKNQKEGLIYQQISSGKFKDTGDPDKALTAEEKSLMMRDVVIMHNNFVKSVAADRKLDVQKVQQLADGSTLLGEMALTNGLIDEIGGLSEVEKYLGYQLGEKAEICW
jgi:signal peptide peptidase SppA